MLKLLKQLAGETAIYGLSSILGRLLHFVVLTPYLTRVLTKSQYGIYTDLYFWVALILVLLTFRMETTFFRFGSEEKQRKVSFSTGTLFTWGLTLVFTLLVLPNTGAVAAWLQYPEHPEFVFWLALIIGLDALAALPFALLRLERKPIRFALIRLGGILVNIGAIFFFLEIRPAWLGMELSGEERLYFLFFSNFLASLVVLLLLSPAIGRIQWRLEPGWLKKMVVYAAPLVVAGVAGVTNQLAGVPMIKWLASEDVEYNLAQAGLYSAAAKLAVFMNLFTQAFNYAAEPFFFRNSQLDNARQVYARVGQAFALVGSLAFLFILLYLDLIQYFLGDAFREGLPILPLLLMANLFLGLYYNFSVWFKLKDRTRVGGYIAMIGSIIVLGLNFWLIPRIGYFGPAWATLGCYGFMALAGYWTGRKEYPIPYPVGRMLFYILLALGVYGASVWLDRQLPDQMAFRMLTHTGLLLVYVGVVGWVERDSLKSFRKQVER